MFKPNPKPKFRRRKRKEPATEAELKHLEHIKSMCCCVCHKPAPSEAHHIVRSNERLGHFYTIPLCYYHHEGANRSIGNARKTFEGLYGSEFLLLKQTCDILGIDFDELMGRFKVKFHLDF